MIHLYKPFHGTWSVFGVGSTSRSADLPLNTYVIFLVHMLLRAWSKSVHYLIHGNKSSKYQWSILNGPPLPENVLLVVLSTEFCFPFSCRLLFSEMGLGSSQKGACVDLGLGDPWWYIESIIVPALQQPNKALQWARMQDKESRMESTCHKLGTNQCSFY